MLVFNQKFFNFSNHSWQIQDIYCIISISFSEPLLNFHWTLFLHIIHGNVYFIVGHDFSLHWIEIINFSFLHRIFWREYIQVIKSKIKRFPYYYKKDGTGNFCIVFILQLHEVVITEWNGLVFPNGPSVVLHSTKQPSLEKDNKNTSYLPCFTINHCAWNPMMSLAV